MYSTISGTRVLQNNFFLSLNMKTRIAIGKILVFISWAILGSYLLAVTQTLGINSIDLFGGIASGLTPFLWEYAQGINRRIGDTENIVDAKLSALNARVEQILISLQNCATEDEIEVLQAEIYAAKAIAHQGTNSSTIAIDLGRVNQGRMDDLLGEGTLAMTEYRITNLEVALREFQATQHARQNNQSRNSEPE